MGEIRIVGPGKTRGYPYPVCTLKVTSELNFINDVIYAAPPRRGITWFG